MSKEAAGPAAQLVIRLVMRTTREVAVLFDVVATVGVAPVSGVMTTT